MAHFGSVDWLNRTGGKLAWYERLRLVGQGVWARAAARQGTRAAQRVTRVSLDDIHPPDSALVKEAFALCQEASPAFLVNHCLRAYYWARLLTPPKASFDDEAVFTALLLHDLGLTDRHRLLPSDSAQCFTVVGARIANALAKKHQWTETRAGLISNAIALHLNIVVSSRDGREAQMVRTGSGADVAGLGLNLLQNQVVDAVVDRHPRLDFKRQILAPLKTEAVQRPGCRIAFMLRQLNFAQLIRRASMFTE